MTEARPKPPDSWISPGMRFGWFISSRPAIRPHQTKRLQELRSRSRFLQDNFTNNME
jgi:hypothetical protein